MKRRFAVIGDRQIHYRRAGQGPAVLLLPPLPLTGRAQAGLIARMAQHFTVLAVDPPGYGLSDPLDPPPGPRDGLAVYVEPLARFIDAFGLDAVAVVGQGAGAAIAEAFAAGRPDRVSLCVAGGRIWPETALQALDARFPNLTPRRDGGHLLTAWDMAESAYLFDPWNAFTADRRLARDVPGPEALHADFLDYLRAGPGYAHAPRAAAQASPHPQSVAAETDEAIVAALLAADLPMPAATIPTPAAVDRSAPRLQADYVEVEGRQLFVRVCWAGEGRPILGLHDPAGASRRLEAFVAPYVGVRPVVTPDLPGSGESGPKSGPVSIEAYAAVVDKMLEGLGLDEVDVIGRYSGGQIAMELSSRRPGLVRRIIQAGVMIFDDEDREEHLAHYTPSIDPRWDGSHLVTAWRAFRQQTLFWPWYNRKSEGVVRRDSEGDAAPLHRRLEDVFKVGDGYQAAYAASFRYPMAHRLRALTVPCLLTDIPATGSYARVAAGKAAAPAVQIADLPDDPRRWRAVFDGFLDAPD